MRNRCNLRNPVIRFLRFPVVATRYANGIGRDCRQNHLNPTNRQKFSRLSKKALDYRVDRGSVTGLCIRGAGSLVVAKDFRNWSPIEINESWVSSMNDHLCDVSHVLAVMRSHSPPAAGGGGGSGCGRLPRCPAHPGRGAHAGTSARARAARRLPRRSRAISGGGAGPPALGEAGGGLPGDRPEPRDGRTGRPGGGQELPAGGAVLWWLYTRPGAWSSPPGPTSARWCRCSGRRSAGLSAPARRGSGDPAAPRWSSAATI